MARNPEWLYNLLATNPTVAQLISGRVYFNLLPKNPTLPAVVLHSVYGQQLVTLEQTLALNEKRFQFDCYAGDYLSTRKLSKTVRKLLQDFSGTAYDGTVIEGCVVNLDADADFEVGGTGYIYRAILDITIFYY